MFAVIELNTHVFHCRYFICINRHFNNILSATGKNKVIYFKHFDLPNAIALHSLDELNIPSGETPYCSNFQIKLSIL